MIIRNSMKQMARTPLKTFLFFVLVAISSMLFVLGINLFWMNRKDTAKFEKMFTTIGVVEQVPEETELVAVWDAADKRYTYRSRKVYGDAVDVSVLNFEGANYIIAPEKRPYFMSYVPEMNVNQNVFNGEQDSQFLLVEVTALRTKTMNPIPVKVNQVLTNNKDLQGRVIWICDHYNDNPATLEEGKTYIMQIQSGGVLHDTNGEYYDENNPEEGEWNPITRGSTQYNTAGECIGNKEDILFEEVTDGFYESERGKRWLNMETAAKIPDNLLPIQPAITTDMLIPFHEKQAYFAEGRDITEKEYKGGEKVCLISKKLALLNKLSVGDSLNLPLYFANYRNSLGKNFSNGGAGWSFSFLNAEGKLYEPFEDDTYKIVGIYDMDVYDESELGFGYQAVIIPYNSVTNSWDNNIVDDGPMRAGTTMFQIPNGTIDSYMEKWNALGIDNVKITFYDGGYSDLQESIQNRKTMAWILLIGGGITSILIILLFCHLFITKQEERTAIERSLGMSKKQSTRSMLSGILILVSVSVILGSTAGWYTTGKMSSKLSKEQIYDTTYTNGDSTIGEADEEKLFDYKSVDALGSAVCGGVIVLLICMGISKMYMVHSLKKEPIRLLTGTDE